MTTIEQIETSKNSCILEDKYKAILTNPNLLNILLKEIQKKLVGEKTTIRAIILHMAGIYVKDIEITTCLFINSESSAGKSYITKKVFDLFPEGNKIYKSKISNEAFTYWKHKDSEWSWNHKILYLNDPKNDLLYGDTFKVMISEGTDAVVVKNQTAIEIKVRGKPIIILTTAAGEPNAEIMNRFNFLNLNESKEQTINVLRFQAKQLSEGKEEYDLDIISALKFLSPHYVSIPFAKSIASSFPANSLSARRYFSRFLSLIQASTALHQFQRETNEEGFLVSEEQDYEIARAVLQKVATSENVFSMTHLTKKIYDACKKLTASQTEFTIPQALNAYPICAEKTFRKYISKLQTYGLVVGTVDDSKSTHRPAMKYHTKDSTTIELPDFGRLTK